MLGAVLHRLIVIVTLVAFFGGMTLQLMPPKDALAADVAPGAMDCAHMAMAPDAGGISHKPRNNADLPECIKQMGCLGTPSLPLRADTSFVPVAYQRISYATAATARDGRTIKPDLFPPIGL